MFATVVFKMANLCRTVSDVSLSLQHCSVLHLSMIYELVNAQVDLDVLKELAWSGTPGDLRPLCWQLLLGYLPPNRDRRLVGIETA